MIRRFKSNKKKFIILLIKIGNSLNQKNINLDIYVRL